MKNKIYKIALVLGVFLFAYACNEDTFTEDSVAVVGSPSLTVTLDFNNSVTLVEQEATYGFTVSLSEPQISDVRVYLTQTGGTATDGEDFSFPDIVTIPAGALSMSDVISIHADDLVEETESVSINITSGKEANVNSIDGETISFTILNLTGGDLGVGLSWDMSNTTDDTGTVLSPTDFADLRLLIATAPSNADADVVGGADGGSCEAYTFTESQPDGEYYVVADFYAASDIVRDLDLTVTFDQTGVINGQTHMFPAVLNTASVCDAYYAVLAKFTKSGSSYSFEEIGANSFAVIPWTGIDATDAFACVGGCDSQITSSIDCTGTFLRGINANWMVGSWGETIEEEANVYYTDDGAGNITIPSQYIFTTLYSGSLYDYTISGTGVIDGTGTLTLQYYLDQEGFGVSEWMFDNGYMTTDYFEAIVSAN